MILWTILVCLCSSVTSFPLHDYDILTPSDVKHRIVRRNARSHLHNVDFTIFRRHFRLRLHPRHILTKDFRANAVDGNGRRSQVVVDAGDFLEGDVVGEKNSHVTAFWLNNQLVTTIETAKETYYVEPGGSFLPRTDNNSLIAYRSRDLRVDFKQHTKNHLGRQFCGAQVEGADLGDDKVPYTYANHRRRRDVSSATTTCTMMLVADYKLYESIGRSNAATTANYMVGLIAKADAIFRRTDFGDGFKGLGFEVREILIHKDSSLSDPNYSYNQGGTKIWKPKELLQAFSKDAKHNQFCMAYLFTHTAFQEGLLGMAWIASSASNKAGGMCSPAAQGNYYNAAMSSSINKFGRRILTQEATIVVTHELGHAWGSQHDPATAQCAPGDRKGGNYIMYTYSVSGFYRNNQLFSNCSVNNIRSVLRAKVAKCFKEKRNNFCGNFVVEPGQDPSLPIEQCDAGPDGLRDLDPCCDRNCKLRSNAICSDVNGPCCSNCTYATAGNICRSPGAVNITCDGEARCSGASALCPAAVARPDGTPCIDGGMCREGACASFCGAQNLASCICPQIKDVCSLCCVNSTSKLCEPMGNRLLSDGTPCAKGYCSTGTCVQPDGDLSARIWRVLENLSVDYVIQFMRNNIVLTILVIALLIYVPICIIIACVDWRRDAVEEEAVTWRSRTSDALIRENDARNIRHAHTRRRNKAFVKGLSKGVVVASSDGHVLKLRDPLKGTDHKPKKKRKDRSAERTKPRHKTGDVTHNNHVTNGELQNGVPASPSSGSMISVKPHLQAL